MRNHSFIKLCFCSIFLTIMALPLFANQENEQAKQKIPGVDFAIPVKGQYRTFIAHQEHYKNKLIIGQLFVKHIGKKHVLLSESPMSLSRYRIANRGLLKKTNFLPGDYLLIKGHIRGLIEDKTLVGYPEKYILIAPDKVALHPRSYLDMNGNEVSIPAKGPIQNMQAYRNILRDIHAYIGRRVQWTLVVRTIWKRKLYLQGPPLTDIKVVMRYTGKMKKLKPLKNDKLLVEATILGRTKANQFGVIGEKVLKLGKLQSVTIERAEPLF